jgi:O-Antigen ligase
MLYFALAVGVVMFSPGAKVLALAFPAGCVLLGFSLIKRSSGFFVEFVTWLFFLTPFVRRVVDFESGAREMSIISTPFLVLSVPMLFVLVRWRSIVRRENSPFFYALAAVFYGAFIACIHMQLSSAAVGLLMWATPILFGMYLLSERQHIASIYKGIERALLGGTLVAGLYGLFQYFAIPAWDAAWMRTVDMVTIGKPEPMEVRVFSIMNSPQILAAFLMVGILFAIRLASRWKYVILMAGIASLALSFARSAWVGLFAGFVVYALRATAKERIRTITATLGCAVAVIAAMNVPPLSDTLSERFTTFADLKHDESALDRQETYEQVAEMLRRSPIGIGLGVDNGMGDAENDSSIVASLLSLGLPGSLVFATALGISLFSLFAAAPSREFPQLLGLQCGLAALIVESPLNNVINGQIAFLTWSFIGLSYCLLALRKSQLNLHAAAQTWQQGALVRP